MTKTDINNKLRSLGQLIIRPTETWKVLMKKPYSKNDLLNGLFYPATGIFGASEMLGMILDTDNGIASFPYIIIYNILIMGGVLASCFLTIYALKFLISSFDYKRKEHLLYQLLIFPLVLAYFPIAITAIFRSMFFLNILTIYVLYLFWEGTQLIPGFPKDKIQVFGIISVLFTLGIHLLMFLLILTFQAPLMAIF